LERGVTRYCARPGMKYNQQTKEKIANKNWKKMSARHYLE